MNEVDQLADELLVGADTWFNQSLHLKLTKLIAIARRADVAERLLALAGL